MHILQKNIDNTPFFNIPFFPSTINECNNLDLTFRNSKSFVVFKNSILKFSRPFPSNVFNRDNHKGITLITRLGVGLSRLHEHKLKHNFQDCLNPICSCDLGIKQT